MESIKVMDEQVEIVETASYIANRNNFYKFRCIFLCLSAPSRPNTFIRFRLANILKPPLINLLSLLKPSALASFLLKYPKSGGFRINLLMILYFGAELGYEGSFILSYQTT